ncbi:GNAT family N-acetyltransferase [Halopiger goleimassiliensis]|uniref:GNAT family N-acetyltransferase n=1 Tax=Halopiger goleimassiliensis TaxID=1293048 RepID=UPI0006780C82|nr:GNAT family N-acetyltransferase [Halopiger goleimassiliensis]
MVIPDISPAIPDDADALAAVYRSAYRENRELGFPAKAESVTAAIVSTWIAEARVYVATVEDELVGGVRIEETAPDRAKLSRLGVHEEWKGNGIGSELVDHAEQAARDRGFDTVWLTTPPEHPFLPAFYRGRGYEKTGDYPLEYRDYDEIVMEKRLR